MAKSSSVVQALEAACKGLVFRSETEAPFEVVEWAGEEGKPDKLFAVVVVVAGQLLAWPPPGYVPPAPAAPAAAPARRGAITGADWPTGEVVRTWQFYALVL